MIKVEMSTLMTPSPQTPPRSQSELKRKFDMVMMSPKQALSGRSPLKSSKSASPSRKKINLTIRQGANQNNKILKYLQPKRLLTNFENPVSTSSAQASPIKKDEDKENKLLEVKVTLMRISEDTLSEHNYCSTHLSPKKYCCESRCRVEQAVGKLHEIISESNNPCSRLGLPIPVCIGPNGCHHSKTLEMSSYKETVLCTMIDADLEVMMIRSCCHDLSLKRIPSPVILQAVFRIMKETADKQTISLGRNYLKRAINSYPPCCDNMKKQYLQVLHPPTLDKKTSIASCLWSIRSLDFFEEALSELEAHIDGLLNPKQLKDKMKTPGVRKIIKPKRFRNSPSPNKLSNTEPRDLITDDLNSLSVEALRKRKAAQEAIKDLSDEEKTDFIFARFEILVDILEWELIVWLTRNSNYSNIRDRSVCPLIVLALWRPAADTGYDSVNCRRIFTLYSSAWALQFHVKHIKTLARLLGLIAEVTSASELNPGNLHPFIGESSINLGRKVADAIKNLNLGDLRNKAVAMIKPEWLRMLVSANILQAQPSLSSLEIQALIMPMCDTDLLMWTLFLDAVLKFHYAKETMRLLMEASNGQIRKEQRGQTNVKTGTHLNYQILLRETMLYYWLMCDLDESRSVWKLIPKVMQRVLSL